jgi:hypothetical protein
MDPEALLWQRRNHQDTLIHTRLNFFLVSQSFLFTAYAISQADRNASVNTLGLVIPWLGILTTISAYVAILVGIRTFSQIRTDMHRLYPSPTLIERGPINWLFGGFNPAILVPPVFLAAWVIVLLAKSN